MTSETSILGNITRNPTLRHTTSNMPVCQFTVAVNTDKKNGERETMFMSVVVFGRMADNCFASLQKGSRVVVTGRLERVKRNENWDVQLIANHVALSLQFHPAKQTTVGYDHKAETTRLAESLGMIWDGEAWIQPRPDRSHDYA